MVVNPHTGPGNWWPQGGGRIDPWEGKWYSQAYIGSEEAGIGELFDLAVIFVDKNDNQELMNWLERTTREQDWLPILFPDSAKTMDRITVTMQ